MKALVSASERAIVTPSGDLWTRRDHLATPFWTTYLDAYEGVNLAIRAIPVALPPPGWRQMTGPGVVGVPLPDFHGPGGLIRHYSRLRGVLAQQLEVPQAIHLRLPSPVATVIWRLIQDRPYGAEVVGDPVDAFAKGAFRSPLRRVYQWWFERELSLQCRNAMATAYVTAGRLQQRYPSSASAYTTHFSDIVALDAGAFVSVPRPYEDRSERLRLITVGTLEQLYKGTDILIEATARCIHSGLDIELTILGEGARLHDLQKMARRLRIEDRVLFLGHVPAGSGVRDQLAKADLFVLPSLQEGLPKAMIEAMAQALPCIGSNVGGIPELLEPDELVIPGHAEDLASKIREISNDSGRMAEMSCRNLDKAANYRAEILRQRRIQFYAQVRDATDEWIRERIATSSSPR